MSIPCFLFLHFALNLLSKCSITVLLSPSLAFWNHVAQASLKLMIAPKYCDYRQAPLHMTLYFICCFAVCVKFCSAEKQYGDFFNRESVSEKLCAFLNSSGLQKSLSHAARGWRKTKNITKIEVQETFTRPPCALGPISTAFQDLNNAWALLYPFPLIIHPEISLSISTLCQTLPQGQ